MATPSPIAISFLTRIVNDSSELIATGDYKTAFYSLQDAIRAVSTTLTSSPESSPLPGSPGSLASEDNLLQLQAMPSIVCDRYGMALDTGTVGCSFRIDGNRDADANDQTTLQHVSAVAIFNMALVCHLQYLESPSYRVRQGLLSRARFLYNQVHQIWEDEASPLYLSMCQNCVVIALDYGDLEAANLWKRRISESVEKYYEVCPLPCLLDHSSTFAAAQAA